MATALKSIALHLKVTMVPHLTTALNGPLLTLEKRMLGAMPNIEHWFRTQWLEHGAPFLSAGGFAGHRARGDH